MRLTSPLVASGLMLGVAAFLAQPASAQRGGYGGVIFIGEEPGENPEAVKPAEPPKVVDPEEVKRKEEERKRIAEESRLKWEKYYEERRKAALDDIYPFQDKKLQALTSPDLQKFSGERDLKRWLQRLEKVRDDRDSDWLGYATTPLLPGERPIVVAAATLQDAAGDEACTNPDDCPEEAAADVVMVTGTRIASPPNVTNVQSVGVDEGDIVKQIGDYLVTLQDGRLFTVNIKNMQLADRADVYRRDEDGDPIGADWYDEMLVQDDHILITAYDYREDATELSIFALDQATGKVSPAGVFLISSDDYYDVNNYASRIIGDKLVLYAPYGINPDDVDIVKDGWKKPLIRRWLPADARDEAQQQGKPLFDAKDIYKPLLATNDPTIHTISICPLGGYKPGKDISCQTTGFLGPSAALMYVNANTIYLWNSLVNEVDGGYWRDQTCTAQQLAAFPAGKDVAAGALYKLAMRSGDVSVVGVNGGLFDQYSLDEYRGRIRALSPRQNMNCADNYDEDAEGWTNHVALMDIPLRRFDSTFRPATGSDFTQILAPGKGLVQNRFNGDWLTYGAKGGYRGIPDDTEDMAWAAGNYAVAVPVSSPASVRKIPLGHNVARLELVGDDVVITGYRDDRGLTVSFLKMGDTPAISDSIFLNSRYETESRSHAFNSITGDDGGSIIGIPTSFNEDEGNRYYWWSARSDISFVTVTPEGKLADAGAIIGKKQDESKVAEGYKCEVSCIDWYGNARPIFTDGRIFGLIDTSLVEAEINAGKIGEKQRIDMTAPLANAPKEKGAE